MNEEIYCDTFKEFMDAWIKYAISLGEEIRTVEYEFCLPETNGNVVKKGEMLNRSARDEVTEVAEFIKSAYQQIQIKLRDEYHKFVDSEVLVTGDDYNDNVKSWIEVIVQGRTPATTKSFYINRVEELLEDVDDYYFSF